MIEEGNRNAPRVFWIQRAHVAKDGRLLLSWHSYATIAARDRWVSFYRERGDRVELHA